MSKNIVLTEDQKQLFEDLRESMQGERRVGLISGTLDDHPVAIVAVVEEASDDMLDIFPLAILLDAPTITRLGQRLRGPTGEQVPLEATELPPTKSESKDKSEQN